jgi:rare lipoprotein A
MYVPATPAPPAPPVQLQALSGQAPGGEAPPPPAAHARPQPTAPRLSVRGEDLNVLDGRLATVEGVLRPRAAGLRPGPAAPLAPTSVGDLRIPLAGRLVELQVRVHRRWRTVAETHTGARGRYRLRYRAPAIGSDPARVRFPGDAAERGSHRRLGRLNVYRVVGASWYGGGGSLACGGWLTSVTLGVANKTLPCGTLVTLRYGGHTLRVPVIDRGPYVAGREFDLTEATKRTLGFEGVGDVWATG